MIIRKLEQSEHIATRKLWEEIFPEDTKAFLDYYYYIKQNPQTLITKFFGLHKLIEKDGEGEVIGKSYFVIMANVFNTK